MARTIVITSRHDLGAERVKAQIAARFAALKDAYIDRIGAAELIWTEDAAPSNVDQASVGHACVGHAWATTLGQKGTATLAVTGHDLRIEIVLPLLLAPLAGFLESLIRGNADALHPAG